MKLKQKILQNRKKKLHSTDFLLREKTHPGYTENKTCYGSKRSKGQGQHSKGQKTGQGKYLKDKTS